MEAWEQHVGFSETKASEPTWTSRTELPEHYYLKLTVEFGPAFSADVEVSREDLISKMRDEAQRWKNSFVAEMMLHLAGHLDDYAQRLPGSDKKKFLTAMVPKVFRNYYEDCGSCKLPTEKPGRNCCTVIDPAAPKVECFCEDTCP